MKPHQYIIGLLLMLTIGICGCGRKQRNIFSFDGKELPRVNKLALPAVSGVSACKKEHGALVSWFALNLPTTADPATPYFCSKYFAGYNVYRLVRTNIIPKHPRNKNPLTTTEFFDKKMPRKNKTHYYLVRAVFIYNDTSTEGPTSLIVKLRD